jgi:hypothetical protein
MDVDVRRLSADLFRADAGGNETTPTLIGPEIIDLCASLDTDPPVFVPVCDDPHGLYGFCNVGVLEKIKADGGTIRFGWNIWEYPGVYLNAEFHAVWVSPAGELIDITPKPDGETRIVFASDPTYSPDFDFLKRPNNRRARLYRPDRAKIAQAKIATLTRSQIEYETKRATRKGMTLTQWIESRLPIDPLPDLIDGFIRDADEHESLMIPVGVGQLRCTNIYRARELARDKQQKLGEIQRLVGEQPLSVGQIKV